MRKHILIKLIVTAALVLAIPAIAVAQRTYDRDRYDHSYLRDAMSRLDNSTLQLQMDLDRRVNRNVLSVLFGRGRENNVSAEIRDLRRAVGDLRYSFGAGRDLDRSYNEAGRVIAIG